MKQKFHETIFSLVLYNALWWWFFFFFLKFYFTFPKSQWQLSLRWFTNRSIMTCSLRNSELERPIFSIWYCLVPKNLKILYEKSEQVKLKSKILCQDDSPVEMIFFKIPRIFGIYWWLKCKYKTQCEEGNLAPLLAWQPNFLSLVIKTVTDLYCDQYIDHNRHQRTVIKINYFRGCQ